MIAEPLQLLGLILFSIGLCLFISSTETATVFEKQQEETGGIKPTTRDLKPITPLTPPPPPSPRTPACEEDPRLEAIRRWQSQGVLNDDGELWWASAAKAKRRNPADDVNPPRIPPKKGRW